MSTATRARHVKHTVNIARQNRIRVAARLSVYLFLMVVVVGLFATWGSQV